jgi:hypothetical protein
MRSRYPTPARPHLMRAERGNPVRVRRCRLGAAGQPTVRRAQFPGGNRTPKKRTPAAERQRESGSASPVLQPGAARITGRIPGLVPGCESRLTCGG